jgi:hypothetical protein
MFAWDIDISGGKWLPSARRLRRLSFTAPKSFLCIALSTG